MNLLDICKQCGIVRCNHPEFNHHPFIETINCNVTNMDSKILIEALRQVAEERRYQTTAAAFNNLANRIYMLERKEAAEEERRHNEIMREVNLHGQE